MTARSTPSSTYYENITPLPNGEMWFYMAAGQYQPEANSHSADGPPSATASAGFHNPSYPGRLGLEGSASVGTAASPVNVDRTGQAGLCHEPRAAHGEDAGGTLPERLVTNVVTRYLDGESRFFAAVEKGIAAADRGEFIEEEEMDARIGAMKPEAVAGMTAFCRHA